METMTPTPNPADELRETLTEALFRFDYGPTIDWNKLSEQVKWPYRSRADRILTALTPILERREAGLRVEAERDGWIPACEVERLRNELATLETLCSKWKDCAEYGWTVIANAGEGNWSRESVDWRQAAAKFRDENYYKCLALTPATTRDRIAELEAENARLVQWKKEALAVENWWNTIDTFIRIHPEAPLGKSVAGTTLNWLKERDDLRAQLAEARADSRRLNWLEEQGRTGMTPYWDDNGFWFTRIKGEYRSENTLRSIIDTALARKEGAT